MMYPKLRNVLWREREREREREGEREREREREREADMAAVRCAAAPPPGGVLHPVLHCGLDVEIAKLLRSLLNSYGAC